MATFLNGPIFYYPHLKEITGSVSAALFFSCIYQDFSFSNKRVSRTDASLINESGLSEEQVRKIKTKLLKLPFLKITEEGETTHYEIDEQAFISFMRAS